MAGKSDRAGDDRGHRDRYRVPRGGGYEAPLGLAVAGTFDYTGTMELAHYAGFIPEDRLENSRDFLVFNIAVSRLFDVTDTSKVRVYFNVQNVGDSYQPDLDRGPHRDSAYVYGPSEMRRAVVGLTYEF